MLTKKLFHGSDKNLDVLQPLGVDMGLSFQKPKWAIFFWEEAELALLWSLFQHIRRNKICKTLYHIPTGKPIVSKEDKSKLSAIVGEEIFVYEKTLRLGQYRYGSSPEIQEFTVNSEVVPDNKTVVTITADLLDRAVLLFSTSEITQYVSEVTSGKFIKRRGVLFSLLTTRERDQMRHKYHEKIKAGELQYGDDLSQVSVESLPPSARW